MAKITRNCCIPGMANARFVPKTEYKNCKWHNRSSVDKKQLFETINENFTDVDNENFGTFLTSKGGGGWHVSQNAQINNLLQLFASKQLMIVAVLFFAYISIELHPYSDLQLIVHNVLSSNGQ